MHPAGLILAFAGLFCVLGALCDWEWFMGSAKARFLIKLFTRPGARIFYGLVGLTLMAVGILGGLGIIAVQ